MASWEELSRRIKARNGAKVEGKTSAISVSTGEAENVTHSTDAEPEPTHETAISQKDTVKKNMPAGDIKNVKSADGVSHNFSNPNDSTFRPIQIQKISMIVFDTEYNDDDLPIFEATAGQLSAWQILGENFSPLWRYIAGQDLRVYGRIFDYRLFNVGYDRINHCAIFQLDETHYYRIQFDKADAVMIDPNGGRVLNRVKKIADQIFQSLKIDFRLVVNKIPCD